MLTDEGLPLRERVAVVLVLLHAQPVSRIFQLTVDDVLRVDDEHVELRLGDPASPVPAPFDTLLIRLLEGRANIGTATNPNSRWLLPGCRAGQHLHPGTLTARLRAYDIPVLGARTAAVRQLVLQAPPPVIAQALGSTWSRCVAQHADPQ